MPKTTDTIYAGTLTASAKFKDDILEGYFDVSKLDEESVEGLIYAIKGNKRLNIKVVKRKAPGQYGDTHYIEVDQFKPNKPKEA